MHEYREWVQEWDKVKIGCIEWNQILDIQVRIERDVRTLERRIREDT